LYNTYLSNLLYKTNSCDLSRSCQILKMEEIQAVLFSIQDNLLARHFGIEATYQ
ncbi:28488_t:CDS:2, partial [Racocetra persica]